METPPTQAALPAELAQSIETMTREIASLKQTVEQLQAGQQQLSRDVAKVTEQEARRKLAAQPPKPTPPPRQQRALTPGAPPRTLGTLAPYSPRPATSQGQTYPQGAAQREAYVSQPAPAQLPPQPGDTSAPRPPMPLR
jgi:septal ring factor EnvC (AmiA/AmiB activator)